MEFRSKFGVNFVHSNINLIEILKSDLCNSKEYFHLNRAVILNSQLNLSVKCLEFHQDIGISQ